MAFGDNMKKAAAKYEKMAATLPRLLAKVQEVAAQASLDKAVELTPNPEDGKPRGIGVITGSLLNRWYADSLISPKIVGNEFISVLANAAEYVNYQGQAVQYASWVDQGHILDRHRVSSLFLNPFTHLIDRVPQGDGGLMVGTQTEYIPGRHMTDAAKEVYSKNIHEIIEALLSGLEETGISGTPLV